MNVPISWPIKAKELALKLSHSKFQCSAVKLFGAHDTDVHELEEVLNDSSVEVSLNDYLEVDQQVTTL